MRKGFGKGLAVLLAISSLCLSAVNAASFFARGDKEPKLLRYSSQAMYHESFFEEGQYPDLFLRRFVAGRKVYVARETKSYDEYRSFGRDEEEGNPFDRKYLTDNDYTRWFRQYAGEVETDPGLPAGEEVTALFAGKQDLFTDLGIANDMLRYSFPFNEEPVQQASAFWYGWYYHSFAERREKEGSRRDYYPNIYVNSDDLDLKDPDSSDFGEPLAALWGEEQDLYLMKVSSLRAWRSEDGGKEGQP